MTKDYDIMDYDPHPRRRFVRCNTKNCPGYALEDIPEDGLGDKPGIAIVNREWHPEIYFLRERKDWTVEDYFELAKKLIKELHIQTRKDLED